MKYALQILDYDLLTLEDICVELYFEYVDEKSKVTKMNCIFVTELKLS